MAIRGGWDGSRTITDPPLSDYSVCYWLKPNQGTSDFDDFHFQVYQVGASATNNITLNAGNDNTGGVDSTWVFGYTNASGTLASIEWTSATGNISINGVSQGAAANPIPQGSWAFVGLTYDESANSGTVYLKTPADVWYSATATLNNPTQNLFNLANLSRDDPDGSMAGIKVWTRLLSQAEMQAEAAQIHPVDATDLWAFYPLTEGGTGSLGVDSPGFDASLNRRHLINFGGSATLVADPVSYLVLSPDPVVPLGKYGADVTVGVFAAFDGRPTDPAHLWTEISADVRNITFERGRQHELDRMEAGTATFLIDNTSGDYSPDNTLSPYYPYVRPMVPIRVIAEYDGTPYDEWFGYVDTWAITFPGQKDNLVEAEASDLFTILSNAAIGQDREALVLSLSGPEGFWRMTGAATADTSGNSHTLTWSGTPTTGTAGPWEVDEAITLDGVNDFATIASEAALELRADMSIEMWVRPHDATGTIQTIFACRAAADSLYEIAYTPDSNNYAFFPWGTAGTGAVIATGSENVWTHIVVTIDWDGANRIIKSYKNGVFYQTATVNYQPPATARVVEIGRRPADNDQWFDGDLSELVVYDRVLTGGEISQLYTLQRDGLPSDTTDGRIALLLIDAGFGNYDLEAGQSTLAVRDPSDSTVLTEINVATDTEFGAFFMGADGRAKFHDRHYRLLTQAIPIEAFGPSDLPYTDVVITRDASNLRTEATVRVDGGSTWVRQDEDSIDLYGRLSYSKTIYTTNDDEGGDHADWIIRLYSDPVTRIEYMEIALGKADATLWTTVLGAELGNRYTITKTLPGDDFSRDVYLESIRHSISGEGEWTVRWRLSPAETQDFWVLGDAQLSLLGETTYLGY